MPREAAQLVSESAANAIPTTSMKITEPAAPAPLQASVPAPLQTKVAEPTPPAPTQATFAAPAPAVPATTTITSAPTPNETLLLKAIRAFQSNQPKEAVAHLKKLDSTNQEVLMYLMPLIVRLSEGNVNSLPPDELAMLIDRLQTASTMLRAKSPLRADRVCFCRGVRKFADIDPFEAGHEFRPGEMVFLYAELKNFTCEAVAPQGYNPSRGCNIRLGTTLELRDARNNLIWRTDLTKNDFVQTPPQDYHHAYRFCVPDKLPQGTYTLWLSITDKPTNRVVRTPVEMRVGPI